MSAWDIEWSSRREATNWIDNVFLHTARIVAGEVYRYNEDGNYVRVYEGRAWFRREYNSSRIHDAVMIMMETYVPDNWHQLLLEWPHKSATDPNRIAYTRDERSGEADRQVVTTIGKYLTRHFSHAPDNLIRDVVARFTYGGKIEITNEMGKMVDAVVNGPGSCMTRDFRIMCDDGVPRHPYAVYDPKLGWSMAVRYDGDSILGRCLIWTDPDDAANRGYVRSYKREKHSHSHSGRDEAIDLHLTNLGYESWSGWPEGTPLVEYSLRQGGYLMPYIDGRNQNVNSSDFTIDDNGDLCANNTNGMVDSHTHTCEDCGEGMAEDDVTWTGIHEDRCICSNCIDSYTYAYSRRGNEYYIEDNNCVYVDGSYYDVDYLSDNNIVELHDGDYAHSDNAVYIESEDAYYSVDDNDICYAEDSNQHELTDNCWQCTESGKWYTDDEESVEIDGELYHPDNAPEPETDDTETETN